ncbi:MAG: hypothetical protein PHU71_05055, partial [Candidatus Gracilibacteria bacterium]|nr:hypothetical protein [Candidatus Gracilibacteria bacterium]
MPFQSEESKSLFILSLLPGFTTHKFRIIEQEYCSCEYVLQKLFNSDLHMAGIKDEMIAIWQDSLQELQVEKILQQI